MQFFDVKSSVPGMRQVHIRLLGTGAADPTKQVGQGVAVTRTGVGAHRIQLAENIGQFVGWSWAFAADTPANVDGWTAVRTQYDATNKRLDYVIYNDTPAPAELAAATYIDIIVYFAAISGVPL